MTYTRQHLSSVLWYIGIGFIGGSISHGVFSGTRSVITALIGICCFLLGEYLKEGEKNYKNLLIGWLLYSVAIGLVSGWLQHFLDSPMRSLWIVPLGWVISSAIYGYKEWLTHYNRIKSFGIWCVIAGFLWGLLYIWAHHLPQDLFAGGDHHTTDTKIPEINHANMDHGTMDHGSMVTSEESFLVNMIPHHQEAVDTSRIILEQSTNPELKKIASEIIAGQVKEIEMMNTRLKTWYPTTKVTSSYQNMMDPKLDTLTGTTLDQSYISGMIPHHQGALDMATAIKKISQKIELKMFADDILRTQSKEIGILKSLQPKIPTHHDTKNDHH
jgi:uncharacterized protein (DUF305 family)